MLNFFFMEVKIRKIPPHTHTSKTRLPACSVHVWHRNFLQTRIIFKWDSYWHSTFPARKGLISVLQPPIVAANSARRAKFFPDRDAQGHEVAVQLKQAVALRLVGPGFAELLADFLLHF